MIKQGNNRWIRASLTIATAAMLMAAGLIPANSSAYAQRRSASPHPRPNIYDRNIYNCNIYDRGYRQGYDEGYIQGYADWRSGASRNARREPSYPQHKRTGEQVPGSAAAISQGYPLGFELGYSDGYFGRARNPAIPANAPALSRSATDADAKRASDPQVVNDSWKAGLP